MIALPVVVSPVKLRASTPGCEVMADPAASGPNPWTMFSTPGGSPASWLISPSVLAVMGVNSAGFATTVLPQARAGPSFQVMSRSGKFHGVMQPTTPTGSRSV